MIIVTGQTMRDLDRRTIEAGTEGETLMERAGAGVARAAIDFAERLDATHRRQFLILAGKGNNGGDGHVIARCLNQWLPYTPIRLASVCDFTELSGDALLNAERVPGPVEVIKGDLPKDWLEPGTVVIDALLGTGITGDVREPYHAWINALNSSGLPVVAVDLPSGVDADTGAAGETVVRADLTVTVGLPKTGLYIGRGAEVSGPVRVVDIGIDQALIAEAATDFETMTSAEAGKLLGRLPAAAHKGNMGRILILGGSVNYPGAPALSASGAVRAGAGLVTLAVPEAAATLVQPLENAIIRISVADDGTGVHQPQDAANIAALTGDKDVIGIGPGLGRDSRSLELVEQILAGDAPVVIDADALCVFGQKPGVLPRSAATVLTPHPGEMARLLEAIGESAHVKADRITQARTVAAKLNCHIVLKGLRTVIATPQGDISINGSGTPALASGGSGDVLTGIIAAFMVQVPDVNDAVRLAVFLHGLAAELAPHGMRHLAADDIPDLLGAAMSLVSPHG